MEENIIEYSVKDLRESFDELFKKASNIKYDLRFASLADDASVGFLEDYAMELDDFIHVIIEQYPIEYNQYKMWFDISYNKDKAHKSNIMFKSNDMSGLNDMGDKTKRYFNYLVEYLVVINHFIMSLEFREIYEECSVEIE